MNPFAKALRDRVAGLVESIEERAPQATARLQALAQDAQVRADAARAAAAVKAADVKALAERIRTDDRTQALMHGAASQLASAKVVVGDAVTEALARVRPPAGTEEPPQSSSSGSTQTQTGDPSSEATRVSEAIDALRGRDRVGVSAETMAAVGGAAAGVAVSGTVAGIAGASTLLGSSTLAAALGGVFVTATPIGWVIASAALAGATGYGIARLIRSGAQQDQARKELIESLTRRLHALQNADAERAACDELAALVALCIASELISEDEGRQIVDLVERGALNASLAADRLRELATSSGVIEPKNGNLASGELGGSSLR